MEPWSSLCSHEDSPWSRGGSPWSRRGSPWSRGDLTWSHEGLTLEPMELTVEAHPAAMELTIAPVSVHWLGRSDHVGDFSLEFCNVGSQPISTEPVAITTRDVATDTRSLREKEEALRRKLSTNEYYCSEEVQNTEWPRGKRSRVLKKMTADSRLWSPWRTWACTTWMFTTKEPETHLGECRGLGFPLLSGSHLSQLIIDGVMFAHLCHYLHD